MRKRPKRKVLHCRYCGRKFKAYRNQWGWTPDHCKKCSNFDNRPDSLTRYCFLCGASLPKSRMVSRNGSVYYASLRLELCPLCNPYDPTHERYNFEERARVIASQNDDGTWGNSDDKQTEEYWHWHSTILALLILLHVEFPADSYPPMIDLPSP